MGFELTKTVDIEVDLNDVVSAIKRNAFDKHELKNIINISNQKLVSKNILKTNNNTMWDDQWLQIFDEIKKSFSNPIEFEKLLKDNIPSIKL